MVWCRQATSHYQNQCWPRSPTSYAITRPQWVDVTISHKTVHTWNWEFCLCLYSLLVLGAMDMNELIYGLPMTLHKAINLIMISMAFSSFLSHYTQADRQHNANLPFQQWPPWILMKNQWRAIGTRHLVNIYTKIMTSCIGMFVNKKNLWPANDIMAMSSSLT